MGCRGPGLGPLQRTRNLSLLVFGRRQTLCPGFNVVALIILNAARRPPRPGRMLGGRHDARSEAFAFAGYRGAASAGGVKSDRVCA